MDERHTQYNTMAQYYNAGSRMLLYLSSILINFRCSRVPPQLTFIIVCGTSLYTITILPTVIFVCYNIVLKQNAKATIIIVVIT